MISLGIWGCRADSPDPEEVPADCRTFWALWLKPLPTGIQQETGRDEIDPG